MSISDLYNTDTVVVSIVNTDEYGEVVSGVSGETTFSIKGAVRFDVQVIRDTLGHQVQSVGYVDCGDEAFPSGFILMNNLEKMILTIRGRKYCIAGYNMQDSLGDIVTHRIFLK